MAPKALPEDTFEEGRIYFYYKPKVDADIVTHLNEVQVCVWGGG